ncbi:hypothetical protein AA0482_2002 [Acetobacter cibinongensis NRIC 0482]|nr:hypothetical protein AA0482_2002 [Acetobacter cibinongensis NRIC 0482]
MLANNTGKQRAGRNGEARPAKTWRSSFISTGEVTLATKMGEAGRRAMAGQEVRLVSVQADAGAGLGMFEALHGFSSGGELADHIRRAARTYYGTASRAYLDDLVKDRDEDEAGLTESIKRLVDSFEKDCLPSSAPVAGQVRSVVRRFGLVSAAGELATAYGVLPWGHGEATQAAKTCFQSWLSERGGTDAAEDREAIEQVRAFIEQHGESRFTLLGGESGDVENPHVRTNLRAGFRRLADTPEGNQWEYLFLPKTWRQEVCKGIDPTRVAKVLLEAGYLLPGDGKNQSVVRRIPKEGRLRVLVVSGSIMEGEAA